MKRIFDRLSSKLRWTLLPPKTQCLPGAHAEEGDADRECLLPVMRVAREEAFAALGQEIPTTSVTDDCWSDWNSWHFIASQETDGEVAGAVRVFVLNRHLHPVNLKDLLLPCGVEIANLEARNLCTEAFDELLDNFETEATFIYVGPLFVNAAWRRSGLAAILGLGANAVFRIYGCRLGLSMATTRDRAAELFLRLGGYRLQAKSVDLPPFCCRRHGELLEMLGMDPMRSDPELEETIEILRQQFSAGTGSVEPRHALTCA